MSKEDSIQARGKIIEVLPSGLFKVEIESGHKILAHLSGKLRIHYIKVVQGDHVTVEMSPYDLSRGGIIHRLKHEAA